MTNDAPEAFVPMPAGRNIPVAPRGPASCATCRYWVDRECRRYAPRPHSPHHSVPTLEVKAPKTSQDFWCGEWESEWRGA